MDTILRGVIESSYPDNVKQTLIERAILDAVATSPDDCRKILSLTTEKVAASDNSWVRRICLRVFQTWAAKYPDVLYSYMTGSLMTNLLLSDAYVDKEPIHDLIFDSLVILKDKPDVVDLFRQFGLRSAAAINRAKSLSELRGLCKIMLLSLETLPPKETERVYLVAGIIKVVADVEMPLPIDKKQKLLVDFNLSIISNLFKRVLETMDKNEIMQIARIVYSIASNQDPEPSMAMASIVQYLPLILSPDVVSAVMTDQSTSDSSLYLALQRMIMWLKWPTDQPTIAAWILTLLRGLALASKFTILINLTRANIEHIFGLLDCPELRKGAMLVLSHMLLTYRPSSDVFHQIVKQIPQKIQMWKMSLEEDNKEQDREFIQQFVKLIHTMIYLHTGFPDLYDPILAVLHEFPKPSVQEMTKLLDENKWANNLHLTYTTLHSNCAPRSETGKTGLVNLGNTCYMNSVLQALYMTDEFRNSVLASSPHPQQVLLKKMQLLFAYLTHTQRAAYNAFDFCEFSRPPWFEKGTQQDCSEYLRHLLDVLHEQELSVYSTGQKSYSADASTGAVMVNSVTSLQITPPSSNPSRKSAPVCRSRATKRKKSPDQEGSQVDSNNLFCEPVQNGFDASNAKSLVHRTFAGKLITSYKCFSCNQVSETAETFLDLHLAFPSSQPRHNRTTRYQIRQAPKNSSFAVNHNKARDDETNNGIEHGQNSTIYNNKSENNSGVLCLDDLIDYYVLPETLEGDNKYFCNNCNGLNNAERSIKIVETPQVLILTLLRFSYDSGTRSRSKIFTDVQYPLVLQLPVWHVSSTGEDPTPPNKQSSQQRDSDVASHFDRFLLYAVVIHSGMSSESGHYYSCARHSGKVCNNSVTMSFVGENCGDGSCAATTPAASCDSEWCMFNDSSVSYCNYEAFATVNKRFPKDTAYILLYRKCTDASDAPQAEVDPKMVQLEGEIKDFVELDNMRFLKVRQFLFPSSWEN